MTNEPANRPARLLQALDAVDELNCEQARAQIPALVEAERAGEDVDAAPEYQALLLHLDRCEECLDLYSALAEDLETLAGASEALPQAQLHPPTFFAPARQSEGVILRVWQGMKRRFELTVPAPRLAPAIATLSGGQRVPLFNDNLPEVAGTPVVSVSLSGAPTAAEVLVAIRDPAVTRWQVQLLASDTPHTAITDERGIAQFVGLAVEELQNMTLRFFEADSEG